MTAFNWFQILADLFFLFLILLLLASRVWKRGAGNETDHESYREMIATLSDLIREMKEVSQGLEDRIAEKQAEVTGAVAAADARIERLKDLLSETQPPVSIAIRDQRVPESDSPASSDGSLFRALDIERRIRGDDHPIEMPHQAVVESFAETPAKPVRTGKRRASTGDHGSAAASATHGGIADSTGAAHGEPVASMASIVSEADAAGPARQASASPTPVAMLADGEARGEDEDERREKYRQALDYARKGWEVLDIAKFTGLHRGEVDLLVRTKGKKV
jgi:hypothetical protein